MIAPVGKSGPLTCCVEPLDVDRRARRSSRRSRRSTSPRLCGGMFVAMPTAMPDEPLTSRFGKRDGSTSGSRARLVVVRLEVDGVGVDVAQHLRRDAARAGTPCSASRPAGRRRRAEVALPVDERVAQRERLRHAHERVVDRRCRRAGGSCPSRRRRSSRTSCTAGSAACRPRACRRGRAGAPASGRRARRAARAPTMTRHRVVEEARAHLLLELARLDAARRRARLDVDIARLRHRGSVTSRRSAR